MKFIVFASLLLTILNSCQPKDPPVPIQQTAPSVVISGHYLETLGCDTDTMRKSAEIESVILKEMGQCE